MPAFLAPLAIAGISALSGLFGGKSKTTNQSSNTTTDTTSTPEYDPLAQQYRDQLINQYTRKARYGAGNVVDNYLTTGAQNINAGAAALQRRQRSNAAARGLAYSPASDGRVDSDRISQLIQMYNQGPGMQNDLESQNLGQAAQFFSTIPHAVHQTGTSNTTGTMTTPNTMASDALGAGAVTLAGLYGNGAFGGGKPGGTVMPTPQPVAQQSPYIAPTPQMQNNPWAMYGQPSLQLPSRRY